MLHSLMWDPEDWPFCDDVKWQTNGFGWWNAYSYCCVGKRYRAGVVTETLAMKIVDEGLY
jgi:hypothetical protein